MIRSSSMKLVIATTSIAGWRGLELGGRGDAVEPGHQQVHDDDVGEQRSAAASSAAVAVGGLADDLEVVVQVEEVAHARGGPSRGRRRSGRGSGRARPRAPASAVGPAPGRAVGRIAAVGGRRDRPPRRRSRDRPPAGCRRPLQDQRRGEDRQRRRRPGSAPAARRAATAASATPTTGSNSIRIPARVPPMSRIPVRNRIDGMAAANSPVNARSGRIDGSRERVGQRRAGAGRRARATSAADDGRGRGRRSSPATAGTCPVAVRLMTTKTAWLSAAPRASPIPTHRAGSRRPDRAARRRPRPSRRPPGRGRRPAAGRASRARARR